MYDLSRIRKDSGIREKSECQTKRPDADNQVGQDMNDEKEIGQPYNVSTLISKDGITLTLDGVSHMKARHGYWHRCMHMIT